MKRARIRAKTSPAPSRRAPKRRPAQTISSKREIFVYDGTNLIGVIKVVADGKSVTYDTRGRRLGSFPNFEAAAAAFPKPRATSGAA